MKLSKFAAAVALLVSAAGGAQAASVTQNITFASGSTNYAGFEAFNLFDSSAYGGATLDSVEITYSFGTASGSYSASVTAGAPPANRIQMTGGTVSSGASLDLYDSAFNFFQNVDTGTSTTTSLGNATLFNGSTVGPVSVAGLSLADVVTYNSVAALAYFSGVGQGWLSAAAYSVSGGSFQTFGTATLNASYAATAGGTVSVTYNYTPVSSVPEPESYAMLLAGLAAIGVVARRRRVQG